MATKRGKRAWNERCITVTAAVLASELRSTEEAAAHDEASSEALKKVRRFSVLFELRANAEMSLLAHELLSDENRTKGLRTKMMAKDFTIRTQKSQVEKLHVSIAESTAKIESLVRQADQERQVARAKVEALAARADKAELEIALALEQLGQALKVSSAREAALEEKIGVLTGKLVKVSKEDLKGKGYAAKQKEAKFGMLLVDEAYALTGCESVTNEFVNKIHKERSSVMMVVVGYQQEMSIWLRSNQGLQARFEHTIVISDYSAEELVCIGTRYCGAQGFELTGDGVDSALKEAVGVVVDLPPGTSPANADAIERVIRSATNNFRSRRQQSGRANSMAQELTAADIKAGVTKLLSDRHAVGSSSTASGAGSSGGAHSTVRSSAFRTPAAHVRSLTANP